ncbi:epsin-2 isoform X2 [Culicoides brevitarsis]
MQMNVAGLRRNIKNLAHNYSDAQVKVREATSNDPWGPSSTLMAEIADLTYNVVAFSEIMSMVWKRTNDHGKNWRHVYKALLLLEYLIKTGSEKVAQQCRENIYAIQTLKEFQYLEEGKDQGTHVREKAKQLVALLRDDERLKNERARSLKAKERFARSANGFGSDGSIDGPSNREMPPGWQEEPPRVATDMEFVRPQTVGEEELQLQLAMAMSREEAEQEEAKRRSDDVRLQLALSQSEQDFKKPDSVEKKPKQDSSHLMDLLDISFGAASISQPSAAPDDAWGFNSGGAPAPGFVPSVLSTDPWLPPNKTASPAWNARAQSPSITSNSSVENWADTMRQPTNGNANVDPWLSKPPSKAKTSTTDAWQIGDSIAHKQVDPWGIPTSDTSHEFGTRPSPVGAITSPSNDLDDFDIISNRAKESSNRLSPSINAPKNNNNELNNLLGLDDSPSGTSKKSQTKTPQSFLGENAALVNLDNLVKPVVPSNNSTPFNPFGDIQPTRNNLFQQNQPPVLSINQLKQQQPFAVAVNQDPWAPVNTNSNNQNGEELFFECSTIDQISEKQTPFKNENECDYNDDSIINLNKYETNEFYYLDNARDCQLITKSQSTSDLHCFKTFDCINNNPSPWMTQPNQNSSNPFLS